MASQLAITAGIIHQLPFLTARSAPKSCELPVFHSNTSRTVSIGRTAWCSCVSEM